MASETLKALAEGASNEEKHRLIYQALSLKSNREILAMIDNTNPLEVENYSPDAKRAFRTLLTVATNRHLL